MARRRLGGLALMTAALSLLPGASLAGETAPKPHCTPAASSACFQKWFCAPDDLDSMKVKDIKSLLEERGVKCNGCTEKADFVQKARESMNLPVKSFQPVKPRAAYDDDIATRKSSKNIGAICPPILPASAIGQCSRTNGSCAQVGFSYTTALAEGTRMPSWRWRTTCARGTQTYR